MATIDDALVWAVEHLYRASIPDERLTATLLLAHVLGVERTHVVAHPERELVDEEVVAYRDAIHRRAKGEPFQYITGKQEFYGRDFEVTTDVLIPRADTEVIVEGAKKLWAALPPTAPRRVVDVGTGSGAIAVTLALELEGADVLATDVSAAALEVARRNVARHDAKVEIREASLLDGIDGEFALVCTNLPYIPETIVDGLQPEVRDHEPRVALVGGPDGLDLYRKFLDDVPRVLSPDGYLLCEVGFTQASAIERLAEERGLRFVDRLDDLQGIPRTIVFATDNSRG
jgi:release factor glutamine methyltransferase